MTKNEIISYRFYCPAILVSNFLIFNILPSYDAQDQLWTDLATLEPVPRASVDPEQGQIQSYILPNNIGIKLATLEPVPGALVELK